jgi:hypothetical protein
MPKSTSDAQPTEQGIFALLKGDSGAGKSVGALSFPTPYVLDFDRKMPNVALKHFPGKKIDYDTFSNIFDLTDRLNIMAVDCPYETIIADSVTALAALCLSSIAEIKGEETPKMLKLLKATKGGGTQIELMSIDYYNGEMRYFYYFLDWLKAMWAKPGNPKHVLLTAHVITKESAPDLKTKIVTRTRTILTSGRAAAAFIPTQFDDVFLFSQQREGGMVMNDPDVKTKRIVRFQPIGEDDARTSLPIPAFIDFTNGNLFDRIQKSIRGDISL